MAGKTPVHACPGPSLARLFAGLDLVRHQKERRTEADAIGRRGGAADQDLHLRIGFHRHHAVASLDGPGIGGNAGDVQRTRDAGDLIDLCACGSDDGDEPSGG